MNKFEQFGTERGEELSIKIYQNNKLINSIIKDRHDIQIFWTLMISFEQDFYAFKHGVKYALDCLAHEFNKFNLWFVLDL